MWELTWLMDILKTVFKQGADLILQETAMLLCHPIENLPSFHPGISVQNRFAYVTWGQSSRKFQGRELIA